MKFIVLSLFIFQLIPSLQAQDSVKKIDLKVPANESEKDVVGEIVLPMKEICLEQMKIWDKWHQKKTIYPEQIPLTDSSKNNCPAIFSDRDRISQIDHLADFFNKAENFESEQEFREACEYVTKMNEQYSSISHYVKDQNGKKWKVKVFFGNTKTWYEKTDVNVKTSRLNLDIGGAQPYERRSTEHLNWHNWVDEPTNTMSLAFYKKKDKVFLTMFHPKFVFVEGDQEFKGHHYNENVHVKGTVDGVSVDGYQKLKGNFGPDRSLIPGQVYMVSWENSHKLLQFEAGYGHEFDLIKVRGAPIVKLTPEVAVGVYTGIKNSSYTKKDNGWEWDQYDGTKTKIMGASVSAGATLEVTDRKDRVGAFVQGKYSAGKMSYDFLDGNATHNLNYKSVTMGVNFKVLGNKKDKVKVPKADESDDELIEKDKD